MSQLASFAGQPNVTTALQHVVNAAKQNGTAAHHVLFHGPAGVGKTRLSEIIASEMGTHMSQTTGPSLQSIADLTKMLIDMGDRDVLFIDEIHRLPYRVSLILYKAMEENKIDVELGPSPKMIATLPLERITIVGATTHLGVVPGALLSRFGQYHTFALDFYSPETLAGILESRIQKRGVRYTPEAIAEIAKRGRGTPRIAIDLLDGAIEYATSLRTPVTLESAQHALNAVGIDGKGLNEKDRDYLKVLLVQGDDNPIGIENIASCMNTEIATLQAVVEPWVLRLGMARRTPRGRVITELGKQHLGMA